MKLSKKYIILGLFGLLALIIIIPLLAPGYILTIDMIMTGKPVNLSPSSTSFLYDLAIRMLQLILPDYNIQKVILFFIFTSSSWGMYLLISRKWGMIGIFGGLLYIINPFVYERVMAGHWRLLLGYGLLPYYMILLTNFPGIHKVRRVVTAALLFTIICSIDIHFSVILSVITAVFLIVYTIAHREYFFPVFKNLILFIFFAAVFNLNWTIPAIFNRSDLVDTVSRFDENDLIAFQSVPDGNFGLIFNLLSGYGFWGEAHEYYILPKNINPLWGITSATFIILALGGISIIFKNKEKTDYSLTITMIIVFLIFLNFSAGGDILSGIRGFREPQKVVGIFFFCYAYFGSVGLKWIIKKSSARTAFIIIIIGFTAPFINSPVIVNGFWGQLKPVFYPAAWNTVNKILRNDKDDFTVLFLPWHQYMPFRFNHDRLMANPAPNFFDKPVLSSKNYETKYLYSHEDRPEAAHVEGLLAIEREGVNLLGLKVTEKSPWGEALAPIGVKYVILSKDDDWMDYQFLANSTDLKVVYDNVDITLYRNLNWETEVYSPEVSE